MTNIPEFAGVVSSNWRKQKADSMKAKATAGMTRPRLRRFLLITAIVSGLDQLTKQLVIAAIPRYGQVEVIDGFFSLTHLYNPGGAFGFLAQGESPWLNLFFLCFGLITLVIIFYFLCQTPDTHKLLQVALALVCGGALGNLADRIRFGQVVDFLDFYLGSHHWPAFNLADSAITTGVAIFLLHLVLKKIPY